MSIAELLVPDFALIALGFLLRRYGGFADEFWRGLERFVYYILFPALLFGALARGGIRFGAAGGLIATALIFTSAGIVLGYLAKPLFSPPKMVFASGFQCAFRFNSYVGLAILGTMHGLDGIAVFGLLVGVMIPVANVVAVWALAHHGDGRLWGELARNPLIVSTLAGIAWALFGLPVPTIASTTLHFLGEAALPIGLIAVGAGLHLEALTERKRLMSYLVAVKLLAVPAVGYVTARAFGLTGVYFDSALVLAALPTASSAYILATQMKGDGRLVASVIALNIVAAIVTLPFWLAMRAGP
ncbi:MAG: transporter [Acidithiobacillales bacterium SM23_46]|jgi:malonate transporter|nr:MAG: transporter [Acidithiobacillales bacterium SM23_46]KPL27347.1 MAG: transporter [Acidithiobacillales bacterium SM1_46]